MKKNGVQAKRKKSRSSNLILLEATRECQKSDADQTMTKAKHYWPIPKLFDNRPSALATEVFCETISLVIYIQNIPIFVSFSLLLT